MKKFLRQAAVTAKNASTTAASGLLGAVHFAGQSVADTAMATECYINLKAHGVDPHQTKKDRVMKTLEYQQSIIDAPRNLKNAIKSIRNKKDKEDIVVIVNQIALY